MGRRGGRTGAGTKAVKAAIKNGSPGTAMMAFAHLPDEDVDAIVAYLVANKP